MITAPTIRFYVTEAEMAAPKLHIEGWNKLYEHPVGEITIFEFEGTTLTVHLQFNSEAECQVVMVLQVFDGIMVTEEFTYNEDLSGQIFPLDQLQLALNQNVHQLNVELLGN